MSERGSFTTQYIYCKKCLEAAKTVLTIGDKYLHAVQIPSWKEGDDPLPIISGKIGGMSSSEELLTFEYELAPELAKVICHPMRIAVLAEDGQEIFTVNPLVQKF